MKNNSHDQWHSECTFLPFGVIRWRAFSSPSPSRTRYLCRRRLPARSTSAIHPKAAPNRSLCRQSTGRGSRSDWPRTRSRRQPLRRALVGAKRRGVDVAVLADAKESSKRTQQAALNALVQAGIPTRTISAWPIHHLKFIVSDTDTVSRRVVETGSLNYSAAALRHNSSENALLLTGCPDLARSYLNHWQSRWNQGVDYALSY